MVHLERHHLGMFDFELMLILLPCGCFGKARFWDIEFEPLLFEAFRNMWKGKIPKILSFCCLSYLGRFEKAPSWDVGFELLLFEATWKIWKGKILG